jgi:hypothetical protein
MNNLGASYEKILKTLQHIESKSNFRGQHRRPRMSDLEVIALSLTAEYMGIDSECQLFRVMPEELKAKIERSVYNRRRRALFAHADSLRKRLADQISASPDYLIIDSMPLEVCKLSRSSRSKICKEDYFCAPDKGYCASQRTYYYGYKLHAVCSTDGIIRSFDLSKASVHDIHYLKDVKELHQDCTLMGDRGYLSAECQLDLFTNARIRLEVPMRHNQHHYRPQAPIFRRCRKRIETLFSQLCDQFMIRRNYAKSFDGFRTRVLAKILSLTTIQLINKINNRNINNLKTLIA